MLSFSEFDAREKYLEFWENAKATLGSKELEYLEALLSDIEETRNTDTEFAYTLSDFCLLIRVFDFGRYSFIYPVELSERGDAESASSKCIEYAVREEIEKIFTDVPRECAGAFVNRYRHLDIDALDPYGETLRIKIKTECELLEEIPELTLDDFTVNKILAEDEESYARLSRDRETNRFWGYDFREDCSDNVADSFFLESAELEFARGAALSLALRKAGKFIGEAVFYAFNGEGGAEIAIRLLPEARGKGLGKEIFKSLVEYAKMIGLTKLYAFVDKRNTVSISFCKKLMQKISDTPDRVKFSYDLF